MKLLIACALLAGCATGPTYSESVNSRAIPTTDEDKRSECGWIRGEMARMRGVAAVGGAMATSPLMAAAYQAAAQRNLAGLETRAANVGCYAAFRTDSPAAKPAIAACVETCQKATSRTSEQCFDACNK